MGTRNRSSKKDVTPTLRRDKHHGRLRVAVLMGGPSAEHEVSLNSGKNVLRSLDKKKYEAKAVVVSKKGLWPFPVKDLKKKFDLVFIAMHGEYGEDGTIQKILDKIKIPYTGSGARASALGMDKNKTQKAFERAGLRVPLYTTNLRKVSAIGMPLVVKPLDRGSSVGVTIVHSYGDFVPALKTALRYSPSLMFERFIKGKEFTCGVVDYHGQTVALLPTEIVPKVSHFFDYQAKYTDGGSEEITPPRYLSQQQIAQLQKTAVQAHQAIGCRGYSRTDFILGNDGKFYVLEINTLPGLTEASLLPKAARAVGIKFPELLDIIIQSSLN